MATTTIVRGNYGYVKAVITKDGDVETVQPDPDYEVLCRLAHQYHIRQREIEISNRVRKEMENGMS